MRDQIIARLESLRNVENAEGMARFGIRPDRALGISIPVLRGMAKEIGKDHELALELWESGYHEARILASMIDDPREVSEAQLERWTGEFDSWGVCDQCISNLFAYTELAWQKAVEWASEDREFVKRAGFVMMARLAVSDKKAADDKRFELFFPIIKAQADDDRNVVKKAVNWALRQIGKRSLTLNEKAVRLAEQLARLNSKSARWIAKDALRELKSEAVKARLEAREAKASSSR